MKTIITLLVNALFLTQLMANSSPILSGVELIALKTVPATIVKGKIYSVSYRLENDTDQQQSYLIAQKHNNDVLFLKKGSVAQSCELSNQQTVLAKRSSCSIKIKFLAKRDISSFDINQIFEINSDLPVNLSSRKFHNIVVFGDSLSAIATRSTNNAPTGKKSGMSSYTSI